MMMKRKKNYFEPQSILQPIEWTSSLLAGTGGAGNGGFGSGVTPSVSTTVVPFIRGDEEELDGETYDSSNSSQPGS
ncbi:hypothetical protein KZY75_01340 [Prevotella salivae]|uniref:Uncharacterized protein n=1 Tax=Segatella salivae TaxID=228604 RepID=A0AAW4NIM1_9BACT|nr:hypothetical protein [Segatella salivae]MBW4864686.1 hypothetical protein [Segatella salivae]MBW4908698.1 hypothetical protein [Segatella salivae]